jgi:hypothetical protein
MNQVTDADYEELIERVRKKRLAKDARTKRDIESGNIQGEIFANGGYMTTAPKGIQNWYDTKTLVEKVTAQMDRMEKASGRRVCHINGRWQLQIRGKHLRRLLKKMPNVEQVGRMLIEKS